MNIFHPVSRTLTYDLDLETDLDRVNMNQRVNFWVRIRDGFQDSMYKAKAKATGLTDSERSFNSKPVVRTRTRTKQTNYSIYT